MSYASIVLARTGLINFWTLDEAAAPWADSVGGVTLSNVGADPNQPSLLNSEPAGKSVLFDGGAAGEAIQSAGNYTWAAGACSIEAWIYPTSSINSNAGIAGAWLTTGAMLLIGLGGNNNIRFYTGGTALDAATIAPINTLSHIVGTYDGTNRRIYLNGALIAGPTAGSSPAGTPGKFMIGNYNSSGSVYLGRIDAVSTYSVALSAADIAAGYAAGIAAAALGRSFAVIV